MATNAVKATRQCCQRLETHRVPRHAHSCNADFLIDALAHSVAITAAPAIYWSIAKETTPGQLAADSSSRIVMANRPSRSRTPNSPSPLETRLKSPRQSGELHWRYCPSYRHRATCLAELHGRDGTAAAARKSASCLRDLDGESLCVVRVMAVALHSERQTAS
jgi:hypothetical protein